MIRVLSERLPSLPPGRISLHFKVCVGLCATAFALYSSKIVPRSFVSRKPTADDAPPGTTGPGVMLLCYMMRGLVAAWVGDFDEAERCSMQAEQSRPGQ